MQIPMSPNFFIVTSVLSLLASGAIACDPTGESLAQASEKPMTSRPVEVAPVKTARIERVVKAAAELRASQEVLVAPQISERITAFRFENGDPVRKGQIIAHLRADSLQQAVSQMDAEIESLDIQIRNQKQELARGKELFEGRVITRQSLDQLDSTLDGSLARRKSLVANRKQLAINAGNSTIRAPIAGVIANKNLEVGDLASPQTPLCNIIVLDPLEVQVRIGELEAPLVELGQRAVITLDAFSGRTFEGRISRIYPYLDTTTRSKVMEISLSNPWREENQRRLLSPGMYGRAEIVVEEKEAALIVPQQALMADDDHPNGQRVFVLDDSGIVRERHLKTGLKHQFSREVLDGLQPGENVVVVGQYGLTDGQPVEITNSDNTNQGG